MTEPVTAQVRAIDAINPADLGFRDAITGGVLAVNVNPGSGNPIGGQTCALKCWGRTVDEMAAARAAGHEVGARREPQAGLRRPAQDAQHPAGHRGGDPQRAGGRARTTCSGWPPRRRKPEAERKPVDRDLKLEALGRVLRREIPWRQHCHRADDIATALRIADEFGYDLVIDHGTEAHLVADLLAARNIPVIIGPLFTSRSKVELRNRSLANPGKLAAGRRHHRHHHRPPRGADHLPGPPGHAVGQGGPGPADRLDALTINPARIIGIDDRLGSIEPGKDADLVIWSGDPLDVLSRVQRAFDRRRRGVFRRGRRGDLGAAVRYAQLRGVTVTVVRVIAAAGAPRPGHPACRDRSVAGLVPLRRNPVAIPGRLTCPAPAPVSPGPAPGLDAARLRGRVSRRRPGLRGQRQRAGRPRPGTPGRPRRPAAAAPAVSSAHDYRRACAATTRPGRMACMVLIRTNVAQHSQQSLGAVGPAAAPTGDGYGPASLQSAYKLPSATAGSGARRSPSSTPTTTRDAAADLATYRADWGLPGVRQRMLFQGQPERGRPARCPPPRAAPGGRPRSRWTSTWCRPSARTATSSWSRPRARPRPASARR